MEVSNRKAIIEGLLFVSGDEGLELNEICNVLEVDVRTAQRVIEALKEDYKDEKRGVQIIEAAGLYQMTTKPEHVDYYKRLVESPGVSTLSQAALETLAIIAYKQPITRAEIEDIRGVKTERPLHTLSTKKLIKQTGRAEGSGRAILYGTTKMFLDYFGLKSLDELPPLPEQIDEKSVEEEADLFFEKFQETFSDNTAEASADLSRLDTHESDKI